MSKSNTYLAGTLKIFCVAVSDMVTLIVVLSELNSIVKSVRVLVLA